MKTIEEDGKIMEIDCNKEEIDCLIREIIRECGVRKRCRCEISRSDVQSAIYVISTECDYCGNKIYENVTNFKNKTYIFNRRSGSYTFDADKLFIPRIVNFLVNLIDDNYKYISYDYKNFKERIDINRKSDLLERIKNLNNEINIAENYNVEEDGKISSRLTSDKIGSLIRLERSIDEYNNLPNYDLDKLKYYYDKVEELISVKIYNNDKGYKKELKIN